MLLQLRQQGQSSVSFVYRHGMHVSNIMLVVFALFLLATTKVSANDPLDHSRRRNTQPKRRLIYFGRLPMSSSSSIISSIGQQQQQQYNTFPSDVVVHMTSRTSSSRRQQQQPPTRRKQRGRKRRRDDSSSVYDDDDDDDDAATGSMVRSKNQLWPPWPFNLMGTKSAATSTDPIEEEKKYHSTAGAFWTYVVRRARIGVSSFQEGKNHTICATI